jgi:uncharacterized protein (DUF1684 family)
MSDLTYQQTIQAKREARDQRIRENPVNWLSLIGLFPLHKGENRFGGQIALPQALDGSLTLQKGQVMLTAAAESTFLVNGKALTGAQLVHTDQDEQADKIEVGSLVMRVIERGGELYLRVWDKDSAALQAFTGFHYFPIREEYCIQAQLLRFETPRLKKTTSVIGTVSQSRFSAEARFAWDGQQCRLIAEEDEDELMFNFSDKTRDDLTYPGGRFLTVPKPTGNAITLDFNLASNWPCAYTVYATCPLPPYENRLTVRLEAGEMRYHE